MSVKWYLFVVFFLIFQTIDCGYSFESPLCSYEYPKSLTKVHDICFEPKKKISHFFD